MLDQMSGGRFQLGVGRGVSMYETAAYGLDFSKTQAMYHEAFQVLLKGLDSEELNFAGEFYKFDKVPMILKPVQKPHPALWYGVTLPSNSAWPAENNVNIVALGLRDNTCAIIKAYRETRAKHGLHRRRHADRREPPCCGGRDRRCRARDRAARLSALARKLPLAVQPARRRATRDRHLSADLRRTDRARQRHRRLARDSAPFRRRRDRGEQLQLFRAAHGVRRHDACRNAALDRAVLESR